MNREQNQNVEKSEIVEEVMETRVHCQASPELLPLALLSDEIRCACLILCQGRFPYSPAEGHL